MYLLHPYLVKYIFPTASGEIHISQLHRHLVSWKRGQNGRWSHSRGLELKKKGKLAARKDHRDTRGSRILELSRSSQVKTGPLCRRAWELRVLEAGPWAACSAEQRGILLAGQISFIPCDSTARCSCRPASPPPALLVVGHCSVRNFCSAWWTHTSIFKTQTINL